MADDNYFDQEKSRENVSSSRDKSKKAWDESAGVDQNKAEALQAGFNKSPVLDAFKKLVGKIRGDDKEVQGQ